MNNALADAEAFSEAMEYVLLLEKFESLQLELEVAISFGDSELEQELTPKLDAAEKAIRAAHARLFPKVQAEVDALIGRVQ